MKYLMFLRRLKLYFRRLIGRKPLLTVIIPFSTNDPIRRENFNWLLRYWMHALPDAEFIIGHSSSVPFCKGEAMNEAAKKAKGEVICILDADAYMDPRAILYAAHRIVEELREERYFWYVPYRRLYRLTEEASLQLRTHSPKEAPVIETILDYQYENRGHSFKYGNRYGAMIMIFPKAAYEVICNFDERFVGWGGEDVCLLRIIDTLWGKHKTIDTNIYHLWHPSIGVDYKDKMWVGQTRTESNGTLSVRYHKAYRQPSEMLKIAKESLMHYEDKQRSKKIPHWPT